MKESCDELVNSILYFAKKYDKYDNYVALMQLNSGFPKIVEMIVYEMFLNHFNSYYCDTDDYSQYSIIIRYATELKEYGFVTFDVEE